MGKEMPERIVGLIERHLGESADDEMFAKAMTDICDGWPPSCSAAHTCLNGGDCFTGRQDIAAARVIEKAAAGEVGGVRSLMMAAARFLRDGSIKSGGDIVCFPSHAGAKDDQP